MKQILAVDDSSVDNLINEILLKRTFPDYEIIIFSDPSEAMSFVQTNKGQLPSLILLDINMPTVSGWDFLDELSSHENPGNVFMLTSSIFKEDEEKARRYTFVKDYFVKPLEGKMVESMRSRLL